MERRTTELTATPTRALAAGGLAAALMLTLATGCVTMDALLLGDDAPPTDPPCQVVATWTNQVIFTPDPTHNGEPTPGLAGRVYLFGQTVGRPVAGNGTLTIDLFQDAHPSAGKSPLPLEEWRIDRDTLQRLLRRDPIGWGYTLFLPWATYRPEISHVHLKVRYDPVNGTPLFASGAPLTLNKDSGNDLGMGSPVSPPGAQAKATRP